MIVQRLIVGGLALLASWQVARSAFVAVRASRDPATTERIWPAHPKVNLLLAMTEIAEAAAVGQPPPRPAMQRAQIASRRAPLAIEPLMIKGALAKSRGREELAEQLFAEARARNPRSAAPRYFLAERYLRSGRPMEGLNEASKLALLVPGGSALIIPALADFARTPGAVPYLRNLFLSNPGIELAVLDSLASKVENVDLVLALAHIDPGLGKPRPAYQSRLIYALIEQGRYQRARSLWGRFSGVGPSSPVTAFNSRFEPVDVPPPFNWSFASSGAGVAEPDGGGRLNVNYYGRENVELASQLLLLPPGTYEIAMRAVGEAGDTPSGLHWILTCQPAKREIARVAVRGSAAPGAPVAASFDVSGAGCVAQWLKLTGTAKEFAKSQEVMIADLRIGPAARR